MEAAAWWTAAAKDERTFKELFRLGYASYRVGSLSRAVENYTFGLQLLPSDPDAQNNQARVLVLLGRYEEALRDYNRSLELCSADPEWGPRFWDLVRKEGD